MKKLDLDAQELLDPDIVSFSNFGHFNLIFLTFGFAGLSYAFIFPCSYLSSISHFINS